MATLEYQHAQATGTILNWSVAGFGGNTKVKANDSGGVLVRNTDAASCTVTIDTPGLNKYGQNIPQITKVIATGETAFFGPLPEDLENDANDSLVTFTFSIAADSSTVFVAAVEL